MTITSASILLLESERMTDTTDGGGRRTNRVIPDGVAGNIFPKVSRVDSVYGRVNLRKIYPHINTANLDVYAGAHFIVTDAPDNDRISVLAFSTGSDFDVRTAARDRIESYVIAGPVSRMTLYGRQLSGSQAILAYQRVEEPLPEVGDVYAISTEVGGVTTTQQFVRVQDVAHEVRTFTEDQVGGEFPRRVVTLTIGAPLRSEFTGIASPSRYGSVAAAASGCLRTTTVADAARYFGIQPLTAAVSSGALELSVASVYAPIVPTTQREVPISLASVAGAGFGVDSATVVITEPAFVRPVGSATFTYRTARPIKPGTLVITDSYTSTDNGAGEVTSAVTNNGYSGTVDYESGVLTLTSLNAGSFPSMTIRYVPQAWVSQAAHTQAIAVTLATRGTVYAVPLQPIPAPGTLIVDFRALGKWYRLRDNGAGELVGGDAQFGTGTVDYVGGGATITLGALPDVGSSLLLSWGSPVHYEVRTADAGASAFQEVQLTHFPVKPGTLSFVYPANGTDYTVTADAAGVLSGGGVTGSLNNTTGRMRVEYGTRLPDHDGALSLAYTQAEIDPAQPDIPSGATLTATASIAAAGGATVATGVAAVAGSVSMLLACTHVAVGDLTVSVAVAAGGAATTQQHIVTVGGFRYEIAAGQAVGTFSHATGVLTLAGGLALYVQRWTWGNYYDTAHPADWYYQELNGAVTLAATGTHQVTYTRTLLTLDTARAETLALADAPMRVDLTRTSTAAVAPGSVRFSASGKNYIDRNGTLFCDVSQSTGSGTQAGAIDYAAGLCTLTTWVKGAALSLAVQSCLVRFGDWTATDAFFRTAGSPIRPASLYVQVTAADGELLTGTADQDGNITGAAMVGLVEQTMGVAAVSFGAMVTAAGNELESWYDADNVVGGMVWKPRAVLPGTLRHSEVVLSNLPLNADILGLDPVRLPSDGRVPIYRPADVVVIHNTDIYDAGTPAAGSTITVGRTGLSALWLEDANKKKLADAIYTVDLAAGTATMAADLSLTGYVPPIAAKHRIEEMGLLSDVQINGQLTLTAPLLRAFPAGSQLSGALLYGDLQARAANLFDQQTWTSVWQGTVIGSSATATYNDADYPVEVLNNGAVTERWRLNFTTTTSFQVIGENLGVIATGTTGTDLQPINNLTGLPYFTLRAAGWGLGWATGNQLRFDTLAAAPPTWLARCVLPGAALTGDSFDIQMRGDVDE